MTAAVTLPTPSQLGGTRSKARLYDIDRAKGLAIALVVFGHLVQLDAPGASPWYVETMTTIYQFHMPFFMYLSGFVFFFTGAHLALERGYARQALARLDRLMVPFAVFGLIVILGKYFAARFGPVHDSVSNIGDGIWAAISNSPENPTISIWYLVVLFLYSLAMPILWRMSGRRLWLIALVAMLLYFLPLTERFYLERIFRFLPFFCIGGLAALHRDRLYPLLYRYGWPLLAIFLVVLLVGRHWSYALFACGLASLPALHGLMMRKFLRNDRILLQLGRYSMAIYLMNTIIIGVAKLLWIKSLPYDGVWNPVFIGALMVAGVVGPIVVRVVLDRIRWMQPIARYLR